MCPAGRYDAAMPNVKCHVIYVSVRFHIAHVLELQVSHLFMCNTVF